MALTDDDLEKRMNKTRENSRLKAGSWGLYCSTTGRGIGKTKLVMLTQDACSESLLRYWDVSTFYYLENVMLCRALSWKWPACGWEFDHIPELSRLPTKAELQFAQLMHPQITNKMVRHVLVSTSTEKFACKIKQCFLRALFLFKGGK